MSLISGLTHILHPGANSATLGMQGAAPAGTVAVDPATGQPIASGAAATGAAQAQTGADGVQLAPPVTSKIVMGSVLKGAMNGVSMMFGLNFFGPKIPFVNKFMSGPVTRLLTKIPFLAKTVFPYSTLLTIGVGAIVGGALGLFFGLRKAKKAAVAYQTQQEQQAAAAAAQNPPVDPMAQNPNMQPAEQLPVIPNPSAKHNKVMGKNYSGTADGAHTANGAPATARHGAHGPTTRHHVVWGDTLWALARKNHTTVRAIVQANPGKITDPNKIWAGDTINIPKG